MKLCRFHEGEMREIKSKDIPITEEISVFDNSGSKKCIISYRTVYFALNEGTGDNAIDKMIFNDTPTAFNFVENLFKEMGWE